ncbi:hypothetical protein [Shouchella shacheensis]|uniref:hypothetical protein n=1 Tax=Shouchella shacheensis TaxID=1649580 RepID=UPI0007404DE1|nr:hypothetical protein [Shouchella shacheensis]
MQKTLTATHVRRNWGQFNDDVVRKGPRFVKRNRDSWAALSSEHLKAAFSQFMFDAHFTREEDGSFTVTLKGFDLVENGDTEEEAIDLIAEELIEYAKEYQDEFTTYFNAPNRREHFPFILNVLAQDSVDEVKDLIRCPVGEK